MRVENVFLRQDFEQAKLEIAKLKKEREEAIATINILMSQYDRLEEENKELKEDLDEAESAVYELMSMNDSNEECIVLGCTNSRDEGTFIGNLCGPCHEMLTSGKVHHNTKSFIGTLIRQYNLLIEGNNELASELEKSVSDVEILGQNSIDDNYTIEKLKKEIKELKNRCAFLEEKNKTLDKENTNLNEESNTSNSQFLLETIKAKVVEFQKDNKYPSYLYITQSTFDAIKDNFILMETDEEDIVTSLKGMEVIIIKGEEFHIGVS